MVGNDHWMIAGEMLAISSGFRPASDRVEAERKKMESISSNDLHCSKFNFQIAKSANFALLAWKFLGPCSECFNWSAIEILVEDNRRANWMLKDEFNSLKFCERLNRHTRNESALLSFSKFAALQSLASLRINGLSSDSKVQNCVILICDCVLWLPILWYFVSFFLFVSIIFICPILPTSIFACLQVLQ